MQKLPLHVQFYIAREIIELESYLQKHPEDAMRLAVAHFSDYLELVTEYQQLETQIQAFSSQNPFPTLSQRILQTQYDELCPKSIKVLNENERLRQENQRLRQDNKDLMQLIDALIQDDSLPFDDLTLPDFIKKVL